MLIDNDLDITGRQIRVLKALGSLAHRADHLDHIFAAHLGGDVVGGGGGVGINRHLGDAEAIAQIDKDQAAVIAAAVHPTGQGDLFADMIQRQFATGMCLQHIGILLLKFFVCTAALQQYGAESLSNGDCRLEDFRYPSYYRQQ